MIKQLQAPRTSRQGLVKGRSHANAVAQQALIAHWQSIVKSLNSYLKIMKANYVSFPFSFCISIVRVWFDLNLLEIWFNSRLLSWSVKCSLKYSHSSMFNYSTGNPFFPFPTLYCVLYCRMQTFYGFNPVITCSLLLRRECCSFSNGEYVKTGLAELEQWCIEATEEVSTKQLIQIVYFSILWSSPQSIVYSTLAQLGRNWNISGRQLDSW
jgi:hypothetical protein